MIRLTLTSIRPCALLGTAPSCCTPTSIAKSKPARSAPVWPPEIILRNIFRQGPRRHRLSNDKEVHKTVYGSYLEARPIGAEL
jgi:hypothetical protein